MINKYKIYNKEGKIMSEQITVNLDILEMMLFYWESVASKDKMSDEYFNEIANKSEMQVLYAEDFTPESVRRVLSCISNREKLNSTSKEEFRFWSQNMRMLEDSKLLHSMLSPVKCLNLSSLNDKLKTTEPIEVIFLPFSYGDYLVRGNKIYFNFFSIIARYKMDYTSAETGDDSDVEIEVLLGGKSVKDYVEDVIAQTY